MREFLRHNRNWISNLKPNSTNKTQLVLFEEFHDYPRFIALSYLAQYWASRGYVLASYKPGLPQNLKQWLVRIFQPLLPLKHPIRTTSQVFKSLSIDRQIRPKLAKLSDYEKGIINQLIGAPENEILNLKYMDIAIGQNYYDWYLRSHQKATIDTNSLEFIKTLERFLQLVKWWLDFFKANEIAAVNVTHSVYAQGIISRIAISRNIPCLVVSFDKLYSLSLESPNSECEFREYNLESDSFYEYKLDSIKSLYGIQSLIKGDAFVTRVHGNNSGFHGANLNFEFPNSSCKFKSMIAAHCFSDAPHQLGEFLFEDFYKWLEFLLQHASESHHTWFVKPHPHFSKAEEEIFDTLLRSYPKVYKIPKDVSNVEIFKNGINSVFTVHGTIALDAAIQGVTPIAASNNASFKNYGFVIQPKTVQELEQIVLNIENYVEGHSINLEELTHYFGVHFLREMNTWIFRDKLGDISNKVGNYNNIFQDEKILRYWLQDLYSEKYHKSNLDRIDDFLFSGRYFVDGHYFAEN